MNFKLRVWRQQAADSEGTLVDYNATDVSPNTSFLEMLDSLNENLVERGNDMGVYLRDRLQELRSHPTIAEVRGLGMLNAIQVTSDKATKGKWKKDSKFPKRLTTLLGERGLITRVTGEVMHFAPPLIVSRDEIDAMVTIADQCLTIAENEFSSEITA